MNTRSYFLSALIAGAVIGVLGNFPLVNFVNCLLCIWVWLGAGLAVFLYTRFQPGDPSLTVGQGAGLGAVSGVIGALVGAVVYALTSFITLPMFQSIVDAIEEQGISTQLSSGFWGFFGVGFFACLNLILYPLFGALGGLIGASLFRKKS
jgi:hypothetical protein